MDQKTAAGILCEANELVAISISSIVNPYRQTKFWNARIGSFAGKNWAGRQFCIMHFAFCIPSPGPCDFNKEQTPLAILRYQPAVSRRLFRCLGAHLLRSPWIVKFFSLVLAMSSIARGHTTAVMIQSSSLLISVCHQKTSSRCRVSFTHRSFTFRCLFRSFQGK